MKILYAVQGTGNGHLSRACAMARALAAWPELEIDWLVSGRPREQGFGLIRNYHWRQGFTFVCRAGRLRVLDTLMRNDIGRFRADIRQLDLSPYDLVVTDFEPVAAYAARRRGVPLAGIGHQYAFDYRIPVKGADPLSRWIMRHFAPAPLAAGLHWHHFDLPLLPPILDLELPDPLPAVDAGKVLVYLPFEAPERIAALLRRDQGHSFYIYHPDVRNRDEGSLHWRAISREGFKADLLGARKVICNSGFELISECLQLGKAILAKPLHGQMEQLSNAHALELLGYAEVLPRLDAGPVLRWLREDRDAPRLNYPDVAALLAGWIAGACEESIESLSARAWPGQQGCAAA